MIAMAERGDAKRIFENDNRVTRIAKARRITLADGTPALAMLITLGDRRGANPSFINFEDGNARDPEKLEGEVKGASAHYIIRLVQDDDAAPGRYRMLLEEMHGLGRTPITRLLGTVLKDASKEREDQFRNPETNRINSFRPVVEVYPRRSQEMAAALDGGTFLPVELHDTRRVPAFDENPEYQVRRHLLTVKVKPAPGRTFKEALSDLADKANSEGYSMMRVSWRLPGEKRGGSSEMRTDLADIGTAMFAHRELVHFNTALSECAGNLHDEFTDAMAALFV
ncbi:MAG TPA: hypothetical protein VF463_19410 [Sphingobium sp.]